MSGPFACGNQCFIHVEMGSLDVVAFHRGNQRFIHVESGIPVIADVEER